MDKMMIIPTNDYAFKRIFGGKDSEDITRNFIKAAIGKEFKNIVLDKTPILEKDILNNKLGVLDVRVTADEHNNVDIEMQVVKSKVIAERILWYWAKMYSGSLESGEDYDNTKKAICILITDFKIDSLKNLDEYYSRWNIINIKHTDYILTDKFDVAIIELAKLENMSNPTEEEKLLLDWCRFIKSPYDLEESVMENNETIKKAKEILDNINSDEKERRLAELREKAIRDEISIRNSGYAEGKNEGEKNTKIDIAKKMLKNNVDIKDICEYTGLTIDEIKEID